MLEDQGAGIAAALDRLHAGGWSVGDTAFYVEGGGLVHVVTGTNGESRIRAEGATCVEGVLTPSLRSPLSLPVLRPGPTGLRFTTSGE